MPGNRANTKKKQASEAKMRRKELACSCARSFVCLFIFECYFGSSIIATTTIYDSVARKNKRKLKTPNYFTLLRLLTKFHRILQSFIFVHFAILSLLHVFSSYFL